MNSDEWRSRNVSANAFATPRLPFSSREIHILFFFLSPFFFRPTYLHDEKLRERAVLFYDARLFLGVRGTSTTARRRLGDGGARIYFANIEDTTHTFVSNANLFSSPRWSTTSVHRCPWEIASFENAVASKICLSVSLSLSFRLGIKKQEMIVKLILDFADHRSRSDD